jgi:hypothetical protein
LSATCDQHEMVDKRSESAVIKLVITSSAYEGEIKVRIDPVHQTELLERCVIGSLEDVLSVA